MRLAYRQEFGRTCLGGELLGVIFGSFYCDAAQYFQNRNVPEFVNFMEAIF